MENSETQVWLDFALKCQYIDKTNYKELISKSEEIGKLLGHMIVNSKNYLTLKSKLNSLPTV